MRLNPKANIEEMKESRERGKLRKSLLDGVDEIFKQSEKLQEQKR